MKVLIADKFPDAGGAALKLLGTAVAINPDLKEEALSAALSTEQPDVLVVRSTKVQAPQLDAAKSLSLVIRAGAGVNTIDVKGASSRGVFVANCPGKNAVAVAELAFAHILSLDRRLVDGAIDLKAGRWNKKEYSRARGLWGRRLGLLGLGGIGTEMISRAHAFGMQVVAWSRSLTAERADDLGVIYAAAPIDVARQVSILSVHLALNDDTRGLVNQDVLGALEEGALFINTARGEVVDEDALKWAMKERGLRAGVDVFHNEPSGGIGECSTDLFAASGIQGTHHIGASTEQAQNAVATEVVAIVKQYLREGSVRNCVNLADAPDASHLLVVRHEDRVGVLAGVLNALREANINVQEMDNTLFAGGHAACARIQIEGEPTPEILNSIVSHEAVLAVDVSKM